MNSLKGEYKMNLLEAMIEKLHNIGKQPQKIGLTQLKEKDIPKVETSPSLKNKNVKLSDLMRRAS